AARLLDAPMALISLVDCQRQFLLSSVGAPEPWASQRELPLSHSICQHLIDSGEPLVVEDAREHPLLREHPAVRELGAVAYLGLPLKSGSGLVLGSFCVIDRRPREWGQEQIALLEELAISTAAELELRRQVRLRERVEEELRAVGSYVREFRCRDRTGKVRWLREHVEVETLGPGRWHAVGICTDITGRRSAEETLRHREELFRRLVQESSDVISIVASDGTIR